MASLGKVSEKRGGTCPFYLGPLLATQADLSFSPPPPFSPPLQGDWRGIAAAYVPTRSAAQVASHAQKHFLKVGKPGGGFIIGSSDSIREGTSRENLAAYFAACRRHGAY